MTDTVIEGLNESLGVGCFAANGEKFFLPASADEMDRADQFVTRMLASFHFRTGGHMLVLSLLDGFVQFQPIERAAMNYGLVVCSADDSPFEGPRVESIMRRFEVNAVAAVSNAVLDSLEQLGHTPAQVFGDAVLWVYPDAHARLAGCNVHSFACLGPAVAMECKEKNGLHLDHFEWEVESIGGEICLTSKLPRALDFQRFATGVHGEVDHAVCGCGNTDPRIRLA